MAEEIFQKEDGKMNQPGRATFRDWAGMARLPNVPTVWSNVFTAWVLAGGGWAASDGRQFGLAVMGGTLLYVGGTILNDASDVAFDRVHRPERPIPAGRVPRKLAFAVAWGLGLAGCIALVDARASHSEITSTYTTATNWVKEKTIDVRQAFPPWVPFLIWLCILAYTWTHKKFGLIGPLLMGMCRALLGAVIAMIAGDVLWPAIPWAGFLWAYIVAISVIARGEGKAWRRKAVGMMLAGLPLVDAVFLAVNGHFREIVVPLACMVLAIRLRKVAAAT